jgi:hypothetical protein
MPELSGARRVAMVQRTSCGAHVRQDQRSKLIRRVHSGGGHSRRSQEGGAADSLTSAQAKQGPLAGKTDKQL